MSIKSDKNTQLQNKPLLGLTIMLVGLALYPLSDAFIKHLLTRFPFEQMNFLRSGFRLIPLLIASFFQGGPIKILKTNHPFQHLFRLAVSLLFTLAFVYSFSLCSLTTVYVIGYTSSFFMIVLSAVFLKEAVSREKWAAVILGMVGVLIAMKPGSDLFEWSSCLVLCGAFLGAFNKILMRKLTATEDSLTISIYPNIVMCLFCLPFLFRSWTPLGSSDWIILSLVGLITATAQYCISQALKFASGSTLAPADYSTFFWVTILDYLWWSKSPDLSTMIGAFLIVGCNVFILFRSKKETITKQSSQAS
ncbi:MAG: DMT family transporter [Rhabdochlamydiaceae bacterium]